MQSSGNFSRKQQTVLGYPEFSAGHTGQSLTWFFDDWVRSNKYLSYEVTSKDSVRRDAGYLSTIKVQRVGTISMPIPVMAHFQDGSVQRQLTNRLLEINSIVFESKAPLVQVQLDPDHELAIIPKSSEPSVNTEKELIGMIESLPWRNPGAPVLEAFHKAEQFKLADQSTWTRLGLKLYDAKYYDEASLAFRKTGELASAGSAWAFGALVWQGHVLDLLGRRKEAIDAYRAALAKDTGKIVTSSQYSMTINRRWASNGWRVHSNGDLTPPDSCVSATKAKEHQMPKSTSKGVSRAVCLIVWVFLVHSSFVAQSADSRTKQAYDAYRAKEFQKSAQLFEAAVEAGNDKPDILYNAACAFALSGNVQKAFAYLDRSVNSGFSNIDNLRKDPDLLSLHCGCRTSSTAGSWRSRE